MKESLKRSSINFIFYIYRIRSPKSVKIFFQVFMACEDQGREEKERCAEEGETKDKFIQLSLG